MDSMEKEKFRINFFCTIATNLYEKLCNQKPNMGVMELWAFSMKQD